MRVHVSFEGSEFWNTALLILNIYEVDPFMGCQVRVTGCFLNRKCCSPKREDDVHDHLALGGRWSLRCDAEISMQTDKNGYWRLLFVFQLWLFSIISTIKIDELYF